MATARAGQRLRVPRPERPVPRATHRGAARNGNVLLFDNGWRRPDAEGGAYSRALELRLDAAAGTARKVWEYRPTPAIYSPSLSSAYRLSNGNTLINFSRGDHAGNRSVVEVDAAGNEVFRIDNPPLHADGHLAARYQAYGGIGSIMDETMLRPPAAAPAHVRGATFEKDYYLAKERARFRELEESLDGRSALPAGRSTCIRQGTGWYTRRSLAVRGMSGSAFSARLPGRRRRLGRRQPGAGIRQSQFQFWTRGVLLEGACLLAATLPEYEIAHVRTGQYSGERQFWTAEIATPSAAQQRDAIE